VRFKFFSFDSLESFLEIWFFARRFDFSPSIYVHDQTAVKNSKFKKFLIFFRCFTVKLRTENESVLDVKRLVYYFTNRTEIELRLLDMCLVSIVRLILSMKTHRTDIWPWWAQPWCTDPRFRTDSLPWPWTRIPCSRSGSALGCSWEWRMCWPAVCIWKLVSNHIVQSKTFSQ
jgi:hypothetical protein